MKCLFNSVIKYMIPTLVIIIAYLTNSSDGHGRLIEPPSRSSAWRYGFSTPPNYNDHELYCGGYTRQWQQNKGKCGECGDAWDLKKPRPNEFGGIYGQGVIVRKYNPGSEFLIRVELTASHMGYFEFRICDNIQALQNCLDKHILKLMGGKPSIPEPNDLKTRFYPRNGSRIYEIRAQMPEDLNCSQCVLQWRYVAGNNWGTCDDGTGAVGCGPQEEFRACADISVGEGSSTSSLPMRPGTKPKPTKGMSPTTISPDTNVTDIPQRNPFLGPIIAIFSFFLVICGFALLYLYHYHGQRLKYLLRWKRNSRNQKIAPSETSSNQDTSSLNTDPSLSLAPPIPPPRTRRLTREISANESSILTGVHIADPKTQITPLNLNNKIV